MSVRLSVHSTKGYLRVRVDGDDVEGVRARFVSVHRLVAFAHGVLDDLGDDLEVHHVDAVPCHNGPANLEALDAQEHAQVTRQQAAQRRAAAVGGDA